MKRALLVVTVLGWLGCQRTEDRATERVVESLIEAQGREAKVDIDRERGSITVDIGRAIAPEGWPDDVPVYPNALGAKVEDRRSDGRRLSLTTLDPVKRLARFYRDKLEKKGWQVQPRAGATTFRARKGAEELAVSVSAQAEGIGSRAVIDVQAATGD
ncbi:MAG: hypothetical protein ACREQQ_08540, partial [Candidatus Binatia bacterium]